MKASRRTGVAIEDLSGTGLRPVLYLVGLLLMATAGMMVVPLLVDLYYGDGGWRAFAASALVAVLLGYALTHACGSSLETGLSLRQAFVLTPLAWVSVAVVSSFPFYFSNYGIVSGSAADSFFESMSGITASGSTVMSGLDEAPHGILMWRALLQWMGGIGIIGIAIAILPALGIGGMQLFRTESSDRSEKAMPRVRQIAVAIGLVYLGLTILAGLAYWAAGMAPFDAIAHALTTVSTAGYSTSDASFGNWEENGIQWIAVIFMLSGALPFVLYVRFLAGERKALWDHQVRTLMGFLAIVIIGVALWLIISGQHSPEAAFRLAAFNIVSIVTTTGYATTDYTLWGNAAIGIFFGLSFIGGCTGSTSGGIKIFRFEVMAITLRTHFLHLLYPRGVFPRSYAGRPLSDEVLGSVVVFFSVFFACYAVLTIALMAMDLDFLTSASGAVTALANVGPGLGDIIGPAGNFGPLPAAAKWLLSFAMLLGRLELFTVLMLFMPRFWRA